jgi:hypothetical protein
MIKVALFVRLEAKPGKKWRISSCPVFNSCRQNQPRRRGSESALGAIHLRYL